MKKPAPQEISTKNTKEQIITAYNKVLAALNEQQVESPQEQKQKKSNSELIQQAANDSSESILKKLGDLKLLAIKQVDSLSEQLLEKFNSLANIQEAIALEQKHLEELYQIKETANTLAALIKANQIEKEEFAESMKNQKAQLNENIAAKTQEWEAKQELLSNEYTEKKELFEKNKQREEEEYKYNLELSRRKEMDEYHIRKASLEQELKEMSAAISLREAKVEAKESTLSELQERVTAFPDELADAMTKAENRLQLELEQKFKYTSDLKAKEYEAGKKLLEQKVSYLEAKIAEQEETIKDLGQKATAAIGQVEAIACRALDVSAPRFNYNSNIEDKQTANK